MPLLLNIAGLFSEHTAQKKMPEKKNSGFFREIFGFF